MKINNNHIFLVLVIQFAVLESLFAQVPMEPRARLHARIELEPSSWFEGFTRILEGADAPYESHRSEGRRDPAVVIRTNDSARCIFWQTEVVHENVSGEKRRFLWTCGFGSNQGNEPLDLLINDNKRFSFTTCSDSDWTINSQDGITLSFTMMGKSQYGAALGYMTLEVPASWCPSGHSLSLRIKPKVSQADVWYRLYKYDNSLKYFRAMEAKPVYTLWRLLNFNDATLVLVTRSTEAGKKASLRARQKIIGASRLVQYDVIARTEISVPRKSQILLDPPILVEIDKSRIDTIAAPDFEERRVKAFMEEEIAFDRYLFPPGKFPSANWKNPGLVTTLIGNSKLIITFFNSSFVQIEKPYKPGRYGALIESTSASGFVVKRFATLTCIPCQYDDWVEQLSNVSKDTVLNKSLESWTPFQRAEIRRYLAESKDRNFSANPDAAIFFAGLLDIKSTDRKNDNPRIRDRQWWIDFKRTVLALSEKAVQLHPPLKVSDGRGTIFTEGKPLSVGFRAEDIEEIRSVCTSWAVKSGEPNVTLIAHEGEIIFYQACGQNKDGTPIVKNTPMLMASITKLLTGVMMMQFVDQGLIDLDKPVSDYLSELPKSGSPMLTVRDLFTHTNGFGWHGEWASDWNMTLENYLAQCLPFCHVREKHQYNRMGYAIAGKIMERLTGLAVPYLFEDYILKPLGLSDTFVDNTYGSCRATAYDMALVGQMLLNRGQAGYLRFFSEKNFLKMLPEPMFGPKGRLEPDWGIGTAWLGGFGLSQKTFGHEAASGALLRIDPELAMVLVSARERTGPNYSEYEQFRNRLLSAAAQAIKMKRESN